MSKVEAARLRPVLGVRFRLAPDVAFDRDLAVALVPRRGRLERAWASLLHRGETRVRLRLDARGVEVVSALVALGRPSATELGAHLGIEMPTPHQPGPEWSPAAVSLLVFLDALARGRVLVTEPI